MKETMFDRMQRVIATAEASAPSEEELAARGAIDPKAAAKQARHDRVNQAIDTLGAIARARREREEYRKEREARWEAIIAKNATAAKTD